MRVCYHRQVKSFVADERGIISVMAAFSLVMIIAIAAIVIDAGSLMLTRRGLQAATDAAALSAAQHLDDGTAAVVEVLAANGYNSGDIDSVETGIYTADEAVPANARFTPAGDPNDPEINAVRVTTSTGSATYFARALGFTGISTVHTQATAATIATASFSAGTRLAELDGGLANQLLGGLLGGTLSLSLIDYQALAQTRIKALSFLDALAVQTGAAAGSSYGDLLDGTVTVGQILNASASVLQDSSSGAEGNISAALIALNTLAGQTSTGATIQLSDLISAPALANRSIGGIVDAGEGGTFLNVFDIVAATARSAGAGQSVNLTGGLPGIAGANVKVTLGSASPQVATGPVGTSIHTAQIQIEISVTLANVGIPPLASVDVTVPVYIEAAGGIATVGEIPCKPEEMVAIDGSSGAVAARFGTASSSGPVTIASVKPLIFPAVAIRATSIANIARGTGRLEFSQTDIDSGEIRSIDGSPSGQLFSDLASNLSITAGNTQGLGDSLSLIRSAVSGVLGLLGTPVNSLLTTLGLRLGVMDVSVTGAKCGVPVLVG
ncbi:MAG: hypothetical protein K8R18_12015 [Parvibaculum sp.]|uniref:TadG family pilus assembly protein n=1 Tax=Parvibaculum sp. TaxID=2024848 RepID=UPI0025ED5EB9|nr:TadG family pilus assembly protein [Parvibaculum sp.]MCE9650338.1 hypothetical protein [Parvibaculum sp.]